MRRSKIGLYYGEELARKIISKEIKKDCLPNHFNNFSKGYEENELSRFNEYLGSCSYYLTTVLLKKSEIYHG